MTKTKITLKDWTYIGKGNHAAKWCRRLCSYYLIKHDKAFVREQKLNLLSYIIIFIPIHILQAFVCMWDGGLREFTILNRNLGRDLITKDMVPYERAVQVWTKYDKTKTNS
jgi:hypothetical protein